MNSTNPRTIKVSIIENNENYSGSLKNMIQLSDDLELVNLHPSAESFLHDAIHTQLDVIILDLGLPEKSGMQLIPIIRKQLPHCSILVLTQDDCHRSTLEALSLGAVGYLLKSSSIAEIRQAIKEVASGGCMIDSELSQLILTHFITNNSQNEKNILTDREKQVLELLSMGYVKKEVAQQMGVSYSAIAQYTENIYKKLNVNNIAAAVSAGIRRKLI